jgi:Nitrile hydratase, alpha chain
VHHSVFWKLQMTIDEINNQNRKQYGQILAQAMSDEKFRAALLQNPSQALKDAGYQIDPSLNVKVLESTDSDFYVLIPPNPSAGQPLSDEHLAAVAGGGSSASSAGSAGTAACPVSSASSAGSAGSEGG